MHIARGPKNGNAPGGLPRLLLLALALVAFVYVGLCCAFFLNGNFVSASLLSPFGGAGAAAQPKELSDDERKLAIRQELGRGTWNMLHRMAAKYDVSPSPERQAAAVQFFQRLGDFYPCSDCAEHFRGMLARSPPVVTDNRALSVWLCERHNEVNTRLGKASFPCTLESLAEKYGDCGCFGNVTEPLAVPAADGSGHASVTKGKKGVRRAAADGQADSLEAVW